MARVVNISDISDIINSEERAAEARRSIVSGDILVARGMFDPEWVIAVRRYLIDIGRGSLPNYAPIRRGAPNFHRINRWDPRAHVVGCFHQFSFFPWNNDAWDLFEMTRRVFQAKNTISGNPADRFLDPSLTEDYSPRLSFQFYPKGTGGLNRHSDPVGEHQLTVPIMTMSHKGIDFEHGGAYVDVDGERAHLDDLTVPGDVVFFDAGLPHGVEEIDPGVSLPWTAFEGRWMLLFAVNHVGPADERIDARDLDR